MARTRLLKPGFFKNEDLAGLPFEARLCFAGLWTIADKHGRLEDRPKRLKPDIFPYDDLDIDALLVALEAAGFIVRYVVEGKRYLAIPTFPLHQHPHYREEDSCIPPPPAEPPPADQTVQGNDPILGRPTTPNQPGGVRCTVSNTDPEIRMRCTDTGGVYGKNRADARFGPPPGEVSEKTRQNLLCMERIVRRYQRGPGSGES